MTNTLILSAVAWADIIICSALGFIKAILPVIIMLVLQIAAYHALKYLNDRSEH